MIQDVQVSSNVALSKNNAHDLPDCRFHFRCRNTLFPLEVVTANTIAVFVLPKLPLNFELIFKMETCVQQLRSILQYDTVTYLIKSIGEIDGIPFDLTRIRCVEKMDTFAQAGYLWSSVGDYRKGDILIDATRLQTTDQIERSVKHELIHAFDDARGLLDSQDCYHQACSEIRAARLSGDCGPNSDRTSLDVFSSGAKCVERRATLAVENNPICRGFSARAVEKLFNNCYSDVAPFAAPIPVSGHFTS